MKIIVCAKQVPDTNEVKIDPVKGTLYTYIYSSILNPDDATALEAALRLRDQQGGCVSVLSMGPPQACYMLRECMAMGADEAYLLSSRAFGGADTCATSTTLAAGVRRIGSFDILFAGRQAIDGDTAQVGPQLAQRLGIPSVTYVQRIRSVMKDTAVVERQLEDGYEVVEVRLPCLLTCVKELCEPRYMTVRGIVEAYEKEITVWNERDVALDPAECGLNASPTQVLRSFTPPQKGRGERLEGTVPEMARALVSRLNDRHLL